MATVTSLGFTITSRWHGHGVRAARRDLRTLNDDMNRNTSVINSNARAFSSLTTAAIALGPALVPIGTVATGVAGGLTAIGVAAGSALGIYAAAMKGAITQTLEMEKAGKKLSPVQKTFVTNVKGMKAEWAKFITATSPMTLNVASVAVGGVTAGISKMLPVVRAVHPIIAGVAADFRNWVQGSGMDRFIDHIVKFGVPGLRAFTNAGKSVVSVLGTGFRAFLPLGLQIAKAIEKGAFNLKKWADGGGFQRFLDRVRQQGPAVRDFFRALGAASGNLMTALQTLGPISLRLATYLLQIVAACPPQVIVAMALAFTAMRVAMVGLLIVRVVAQGIMLLRTAWLLLNIAWLLSPIGVIITGLVVLGTAIYLLATRTRFFQTVWRVVWGAVRAFGLAVWNGLRIAGIAIWNGMRAAWSAVCNFFRNFWRVTWSGIRAIGVAIWTGIRTVGVAIWNGMRNAWRSVLNAMRAVWRAIWNSIRAVGIAIWNGIRAAGSRFWNGLRNGFRGALNGIRSVWRSIWNAISSFTRGVWNRMLGAGRGFWNAMRRGFAACVSGIRTAWNKLRGVVAAPVRFFVNTVYGGLRRAWNNTAGKIPGVPDLPAARVGFASGGFVSGPGGPRQDKIPAMLSNGEYVINAKAVRKLGVSNLDQLNGGGAGVGRKSKAGLPGMMLGGLLPDPGDILKSAAKGVGGMFGEMFKLAKSIPGLGKMLDGMLKWGGDLTKDILRGAMKILFKPFKGMLSGIMGRFGKSGMVGTFVKNFGLNAFGKMANFVVGKGKNDFNPADFAGGFGGGGGNWMPTVLMALKMAGEPLMYASLVLRAIMKESGGNPRAINLWDSNAKRGTPSMGLLQTIGPTFNAYAGALRGLGPFNPLANVYAAIRYARSRYGSGWAARMAAPGGYASGGLVANSFDSGGYLPKGLSLAYNGTGRPEPVGHDLGGVSVHFHNCTFSGGQNDFEDMVVKAVSNARRKKRIP